MGKNEALYPVKYIGFYPVFVDRLYGSGLIFQQGQTLNVSSLLAAKLLRHVDMFEAGNGKEAETPKQSEPVKDPQNDELEQQNDILDQLMIMDKNALRQFALQNYEQKIDTRNNINVLREEVRNMVNQFGVV